MAAGTLRMRNRDLATMTITVTMPRIFRFRVWLGLRLIKLGARVTGVGFEVVRGD
jgi:hypothetical protein